MDVHKKSSYTTQLVVRASKNTNRKHYSKKSFKTKLADIKRLLPLPSDYYPNHLERFKRNSKQAIALCPFHSDTNPSFTVNLKTGAFICFACGARGGDVLSFHMKYYSLCFMDACKALGVWHA